MLLPACFIPMPSTRLRLHSLCQVATLRPQDSAQSGRPRGIQRQMANSDIRCCSANPHPKVHCMCQLLLSSFAAVFPANFQAGCYLVSLFFISDAQIRCASCRAGDPATYAPLSVATTSTLNVTMSFSDGTVKDFSSDSRAVFTFIPVSLPVQCTRETHA